MATPIRSFEEQTLRTISLFQAIVAFPIVVFLGGSAFFTLYESYSLWWGSVYYFFSEFFNALFGAGIIFIAIIQRRTCLPKKTTLILEAEKSVLATAMWLWLLCDTLFGPWRRHWNYYDHDKVMALKLIETFTAIIILFLLFYSSLVYAYIQWKSKPSDGPSDDEAQEYGGEAVRTEEERPLLSGSQ